MSVFDTEQYKDLPLDELEELAEKYQTLLFHLRGLIATAKPNLNPALHEIRVKNLTLCVQAKRNGEHGEATKYYRSATGCSLREAHSCCFHTSTESLEKFIKENFGVEVPKGTP
jgi:ribosomal protein L7/L12